MAKRNNRIDADVTAFAIAGLSQREIAKKLAISKTTVSKILNERKSDQKLANAKKVTTELQEEAERNNQKKAHDAIDQIISDLQKDLKKASLKDKRETLKTLVELFGLPDDGGRKTPLDTEATALRRALENRQIEGFDDEQDDLQR